MAGQVAGVGAGSAADFERRSALYAGLDARFSAHTRFFAAAALVNGVFAELFELLPLLPQRRSLTFINEVGAALEAVNLQCAGEILAGTQNSHALDQVLVCAEQKLLQSHVKARQAERPHQWNTIRRELNTLLNDKYAASLVSPWMRASARLSRVVREVRGHLGIALDFGIESHRVSIGLALIENIRRDPLRPLSIFPSVSTYGASAHYPTD